MSVSKGLAAFLAALASTSLPAVAAAQDSPRRGDTVLDRVRPTANATGMPLSGDWRLYPSIDVAEHYSSNIYAASTNTVDDFITRIRPELTLASGRQVPTAALRFFGDLQYHANETSEDAENYGTEGRLRSSGDGMLQFDATAGFARQTRDRANPEEQPDIPRTELNRYFGRAQANLRSGRTRLGMSGEVRRLDFVQSFNEDRDRKDFILRGELGLQRSSTEEIYLAPIWQRVRYDEKADRFGFNRDREELSVHAGLLLDLGGIVFGRVEAGVTDISFTDQRFDDHRIATALVDLDWNITRLTTLSLTGERTPQATVQANSSVRIDTSALLAVAHELRRYLILELEGGYEHWDFAGIPRSDNVWQVGGGFTYLMNRYVHIVGEYSYFDRGSDRPRAEFSRHQAMLSLRLQL